jgi:chromosome partitioning protein
MPLIVSFLSQKGGVGKSTLARALAAVAAYDLRVRLADLDEEQATVVAWERARRKRAGRPLCAVVACMDIETAIAESGDAELLIIDAPSRSGSAALEIARRSHLIVQPSGASADDLRPAVILFHELVKAGIPKDRLVAAVCRVMSDTEEAAVRGYLVAAGYDVLAGSIPERSAYREIQNRGAAINETRIAKLNQRTDALMESLLGKVTQGIGRAVLKRAAGRDE